MGRGFIAPLLKENGYRVVFVDSSNDMVEKINNQKQYKLTIYDKQSRTEIIVEKIRALHTAEDQLLKEKVKFIFLREVELQKNQIV